MSLNIDILKNKSRKICSTLIDKKNAYIVYNHSWSLQQGYLVNNKGEKLHNLILNITPNRKAHGDHKDRNKLNNLESNLRFTSCSQNNMNRNTFKNNTSKYKGVSLDKNSGKWKVHITVRKVTIYLGYYKNKELAAKVYNIASKFLHKEYGVKNILPKSFNFYKYHPSIYIEALRKIKVAKELL